MVKGFARSADAQNWHGFAADVNNRAYLLEAVQFSQHHNRALHGLTERQKLACALRFYGDSAGPLPLKLIGLRMGIKRSAVCRLIARGAARIRANGYEIANLTAQVLLAA